MSALALRIDDEALAWNADLLTKIDQAGIERLQPQTPNDFCNNYADPLHWPVSDTSQTCEETEMDLRHSKVRKIQAPQARRCQASDDRQTLADQMGQDDLAIATRTALRAAFGDSNSAIKRIACVANCNARAARNWFEGENPPSLLYALRLMAHVPEFQAEVRRLAAMEGDLDPNFERAMSEAIQVFQQVSGRGK